MKKSVVYSFAWISTAVAVSIGIYITKSATPLWAMAFPAMVTNKSKEEI